MDIQKVNFASILGDARRTNICTAYGSIRFHRKFLYSVDVEPNKTGYRIFLILSS